MSFRVLCIECRLLADTTQIAAHAPIAERHFARTRLGKDGFDSGQQRDGGHLIGIRAHGARNADGVAGLQIRHSDGWGGIDHGLEIPSTATASYPEPPAARTAAPKATGGTARTTAARAPAVSIS